MKNWDTRDSIVDNFLDIATMDVSSPHDGAVFFSGPKAKRKAKKLARQSDGEMMTVIDTPALTEFVKNQRHYFGKDAKMSLQEGYLVGDWISERFSEQATGTVRVYLDGVKPHGTFNRAEVPALLDNPNVDKFLVYDAQPTVRGVQPFQEMELNKEDFETYILRKIECMPDRRIGQKHIFPQSKIARDEVDTTSPEVT